MTDEVDGLFSWVVVAVCFVVYFMNYGMNRIAGLIFSNLISFYTVDRELASTPFLMGSVARSISGPVCGYLSHTLGFRFAIIFGCFLSSLGILGCSFAQNISVLCAFWTIFGFGSGMSTVILPRVINLFSKKHAAKAIGIAMCGASTAGITLPFLTVVLLNTYGMQGTFLNLSAIMLNTIPCAILLRNPNFGPLKGKCQKDMSADNETMQEEKKPSGEKLEISFNPKISCLSDSEHNAHYMNKQSQDLPIEQASFEELSITTHGSRVGTQGSDLVKIKESCVCASRNLGENIFYCEVEDTLGAPKNVYSVKNACESFEKPSLLYESKLNSEVNKCSTNDGKSPKARESSPNHTNKAGISKPGDRFSAESSHSHVPVVEKKQNCLQVFGIIWDPVFLTFVLPRCFSSLIYIVVPTIVVDFSTDKGIEMNQSTYVLMAFSVADMSGKLCLGWITDGKYMSKIRYAALWYCIVAVSFGLMAWSNGLVAMTIAVSLVAMGVATIAPTLFVLVSEYFEKEQQSMAITSSEIFMLPLCFGTSPLIGYFRDHLGSYNGLAYILSGISILCSVLLLLIPCISKWRMKRKCNNSDVNTPNSL